MCKYERVGWASSGAKLATHSAMWMLQDSSLGDAQAHVDVDPRRRHLSPFCRVSCCQHHRHSFRPASTMSHEVAPLREQHCMMTGGLGDLSLQAFKGRAGELGIQPQQWKPKQQWQSGSPATVTLGWGQQRQSSAS